MVHTYINSHRISPTVEVTVVMTPKSPVEGDLDRRVDDEKSGMGPIEELI